MVDIDVLEEIDQIRHEKIELELNKLWGHILYGIGLPNDKETRDHVAYMFFHKALTLCVDMNKMNFGDQIKDDVSNMKKMEELRDFIKVVYDVNKAAMKIQGYL